jgi:hypothetical protein
MPGGGGGKGGGGKGGGSTTSRVEVINSGTTNVDVDSTVEIQGLDDMRQTVTLNLPQPFRTESRQEVAVTQPVVTEGSNEISLDIRPLTLDLCLNVNMGPPAPACIRQPYTHHFGLTLFGIELMGLNFSGESQTIVQEMPKQPQVAWGKPGPGKRPPGKSAPPTRSPAPPAAAGGQAGEEPRSGLRIRLE